MEYRHHFPVLTQSRNVAFKSQCLVSRLIVHVVLEGVHFSDWRCVYQALTTTRLPLAGLRRGSFENECVVGRGILGVE